MIRRDGATNLIQIAGQLRSRTTYQISILAESWGKTAISCCLNQPERLRYGANIKGAFLYCQFRLSSRHPRLPICTRSSWDEDWILNLSHRHLRGLTWEGDL
jgi:hypothetical protein